MLPSNCRTNHRSESGTRGGLDWGGEPCASGPHARPKFEGHLNLPSKMKPLGLPAVCLARLLIDQAGSLSQAPKCPHCPSEAKSMLEDQVPVQAEHSLARYIDRGRGRDDT